MYRKRIKRLLDFIISSFSIILFFPLMAVISILIKINLGSPIIFTQKRPGYKEKIFKMYKFRSMTNETDENGKFLSDDKRLTPFGKFLRSTSLDELPELFNILKGDMSIVGPRPQLVSDMIFMTPEQRQRHQVLPGLTGLAQINGRNNINWEDKIRWDLQYIKHISLRTDCFIVFMTIIKVLKKEGICSQGLDTAEDLGDYLLRTGKITKDEYMNALIETKKRLGECE